MTCELSALTFRAQDPVVLADFWGGLLGWEQAEDRGDGGTALVPSDETGFEVRFIASADEKVGPNLGHFDLTSATHEEQQETVERALALRGRHLDIGQGPDVHHVVLADPEGNEFCVIEAGNNFLADCGFIGALASDGSQAVGYFWSQALGWPLVWDQDEESAIQSPHGGPKMTWGGPPLNPKVGRQSVLFDLTPQPGQDLGAEVDRLVSLGAGRLTGGQQSEDRVVLTDPDGNEFWVTPRSG